MNELLPEQECQTQRACYVEVMVTWLELEEIHQIEDEKEKQKDNTVCMPIQFPLQHQMQTTPIEPQDSLTTTRNFSSTMQMQEIEILIRIIAVICVGPLKWMIGGGVMLLK